MSLMSGGAPELPRVECTHPTKFKAEAEFLQSTSTSVCLKCPANYLGKENVYTLTESSLTII